MTLRDIIQHLAKGNYANLLQRFNHGRANHMSMQTLTNKLNPRSESHNINADELETIVDYFGGGLEVADYFAAKANGVVARLPDVGESDMALLDGFMNITKELGDVGMGFKEAYADGDISKEDVIALDKEIDETVAALLAFKKRYADMVR